MNNNIKKSLLITLDFPPQTGGVANFYNHVCQNLPPDKIVVLAPSQAGDQDFDQKQDFPIIRKKMLSPTSSGLMGISKITARLKWISMIRYFYQLAKAHQIELIQVGQILPIGTLALTYQHHKKIPYIFYAHGLDILMPQKFARKKRLMKKIIANAKAIVANSYFTKDELIKLGADSAKIIVVHPGPNLLAEEVSKFKIKETIEAYNLKDKKILLTVGRLVKRKGQDMVIAALPEIIKKVPDLKYLIVGTGPYQKTLAGLVDQKKLANYVKFINPSSENDLAALYQLCDVFIMPSRQLLNGDVEGFGIVYLEANSFGKPVIGGRSGGVPEAVIDGQTGILVDPTNIDQIAQQTIRLLTNRALAERLGLQGLERVADEFDWKVQTEKIKQILK